MGDEDGHQGFILKELPYVNPKNWDEGFMKGLYDMVTTS